MATQTTLFTPILGCKKDGYFCNHLIFRAESGARNSRTLMRPRVGYIYIPPKSPFGKGGLQRSQVLVSAPPQSTRGKRNLRFPLVLEPNRATQRVASLTDELPLACRRQAWKRVRK